MHIYYFIAGQEVKPLDLDSGQIGQEDRAIVERVTHMLKEKVGDLKCPTHGEEPSAIIAGPSYKELGLEINGCCEDVVDSVSQMLNPGQQH